MYFDNGRGRKVTIFEIYEEFFEENYHNVFHFSEIELHKRYYGEESHFIELKEFNKSEEELENRLDYWI
jgi:hypothetical protein